MSEPEPRISQFTSLYYATHKPLMAGGQKFDESVENVENEPSDKQAENEMPFANRSTPIEYHALRCTEHLSKREQCPNAQKPVRKKVLQRLATTRGVENSRVWIPVRAEVSTLRSRAS